MAQKARKEKGKDKNQKQRLDKGPSDPCPGLPVSDFEVTPNKVVGQFPILPKLNYSQRGPSPGFNYNICRP
jgi:hypothetical protein